MAALTTVRWRRYGKDRLYVNDGSGTTVGWVDLVTGARTVTDSDSAVPFADAVDAWYAEQPPAALGTASTPVPQPRLPADRHRTAPGPPPLWHDLALQHPGAAARAQAERELAVMRQRSRLGTFLARAFDVKTDERAWRLGANGEERVGGLLEPLRREGWHVLHAVPVGTRGSDIDHVLVGPGGVFTVNTKFHPDSRIWVSDGQVRVNGQPTHYLSNSRFEGERASRLLSTALGEPVPVQPVLVILTGTRVPAITVRRRPKDVWVLGRPDVPGAFGRTERRLTSEHVQRVYDAAQRCTTWSGDGRCCCATAAG